MVAAIAAETSGRWFDNGGFGLGRDRTLGGNQQSFVFEQVYCIVFHFFAFQYALFR